MPHWNHLWVFLLFVGVVLVAAPLGVEPAFAGKKKKKNARPSDQERGTQLYERHCLACHGSLGRGDGPAGKALVQPPADLRGVLLKENISEFVSSVTLGKNGMPGFELSFDKHDTRRVLRTMVRLLESEPKVEAEEEVEGEEEVENETPPDNSPPENGQEP